MKKIALLFLFFVAIAGFSQEKKTYEIGVLIDFALPEMMPLLDELKNEITAVVGEDAVIHFSDEYRLSNDLNLEKAEVNYQTLLNAEVDIILAFGVINNTIITKKKVFPKPTILFGAVNEDLLTFDQEKQSSGITNFTYLVASRSYKKDLATFKELTSFKRVGIIVQQQFFDIFPYSSLFDAELENLQASYKLIPFSTYEDIAANLNDIDAVYIAEGFYLSQAEMTALANECIRLKLPSFTANNIDEVKNGILATNQAEQNITQFFRRIALTVEGYVGGAQLEDLPTYINFDSHLTVNYNTAERIGLPLKYSLIANTDFLGDFDKRESEKKYNILEVMNDVLENNLPLQSSQKDIDLSEKDVQVAWANYLPSVTANTTATYLDPDLAAASMGLNPEYSTDGNITLQQTIFSPDANTNIKTQKDLLQSQRQNFNTDQLDALFDVSNAYFNALILKSNLRIRATNMNLTKRNLQIAKDNFEAGLAGKSDVLRFRSELAQDMQAMIEAANSLDQGFFALNQLLNNPLDYDIDVDEAELEEGLYKEYSYIQLRELLDDPLQRSAFVKFLIQEAKNNAPELKSLDYNIAAIGRSVKLNTAGRFLPTLALQGQYNKNFNQWGAGVNQNALDKNYNVGLSLSIPLIDQNRKNINRQIALIQKDQLDINKSNTQLTIETNVSNAVLAIINEISNIELSTVSETAAEEALDLTQASYSNGAVTVVQLIDAQNNYLNASLARFNAVYNYLLSSLRLERFLGYYFLMHTKVENDEFISRFTTFLEQNNN